MKEIILLPRYFKDGASSRIRTYNHLDLFKKLGKVKVFQFHHKKYIKLLYEQNRRDLFLLFFSVLKRIKTIFVIKNNSFIYVEKEFFPQSIFILEFLALKLLKFKGCKIFIDFDDATFVSASINFLSKIFISPKYNYLCKKADEVTVGSTELFKWAQKYNKNITKISSSPQISSIIARKDNSNKKLSVGWIGTPNTQKYIKEVVFNLPREIKEDMFEFKLMGTNFKTNLSNKIKLYKWSLENEIEFLNDIDIGLMPIAFRNFEKYKSAYKIFQYMASYTVPIASSWGENSYIIKNGFSGFLFKEIDQLISYLKLLNEDRYLLEKIKLNAFKEYNNKYALEIQDQKLKHLIEKYAS